MDYHFVLPKDEAPTSSQPTGVGRLIKKLAPVFVLAAILPVFLVVALSPTDLKFLTRADSDAELRIWFEPSQIITSPGKTTSLKVYAQFESDSQVLPGVSFRPVSEGLHVQGEISYLKPFNGEIELGEIEVIAPTSGSFEVTIPQDTVETAYTNPLAIVTSSARIHVR